MKNVFKKVGHVFVEMFITLLVGISSIVMGAAMELVIIITAIIIAPVMSVYRVCDSRESFSDAYMNVLVSVTDLVNSK